MAKFPLQKYLKIGLIIFPPRMYIRGGNFSSSPHENTFVEGISHLPSTKIHSWREFLIFPPRMYIRGGKNKFVEGR